MGSGLWCSVSRGIRLGWVRWCRSGQWVARGHLALTHHRYTLIVAQACNRVDTVVAVCYNEGVGGGPVEPGVKVLASQEPIPYPDNCDHAVPERTVIPARRPRPPPTLLHFEAAVVALRRQNRMLVRWKGCRGVAG